MEIKKELGSVHTFSIAAGAMISSGIFVLPSVAYLYAGNAILLSYLLAGILLLPALFSQLELTTALPKAGGTYFYAERILGTAAGVMDGFSDWMAITLKSAFALVGIGVFATLLFPDISDFHLKMISAGACILFTGINLIGSKESGHAEVVLVVFLLISLSLFLLFGWREIDFSKLSSFQLLPQGESRWAGLSLILSTTGMVFISYGGLTSVSSVAEEVKDVQKNVVRGEILAFLVVQILYLLIIATLLFILPSQTLKESLTPLSTAASQFHPHEIANVFVIVTAFAAMMAFITTANAGLLSASRAPLAMARDGLLPDAFARISKKRGTPTVSILTTSGVMLLVILFLDIEHLAKVASLFILFIFIIMNISVIIVRKAKLQNYKPTFKSPFFPVTQIFGIVIYLFLIFQMGGFTIAAAAIFIGLAFIWYLIYAKNRVRRKSALMHLVENAADPSLTAGEDETELEKELLNILIESNEIVEDRFDRLIRSAPVIDMEATCTREEAFRAIAKEAEKSAGLSAESVFKKLNEREEVASTLIYPGVAVPHAIPHVILEGEHQFQIILLRNRFGIRWNEAGEVVYTAFCLMGSKDERNFHLRALMAIAQILQDKAFNDEWMSAKSAGDLRNAILLRKRKRDF